MLDSQNRLQNCFKNAKTTKFLSELASTLPKDTPAKFYLSTTFSLRLMISYVAPTRLSTFYAYLITKIGNRNLKCARITCVTIPIIKRGHKDTEASRKYFLLQKL